MYVIHQKQRGRNSLSLVCKRDWIINGLEGEHIFSRAKHHERAIILARWQMKRMVHLYGTSFSNLPSDNKPKRISYFLSASKFLWQFNYLCWNSVDGSFVSEKLEVWVMKQKLHAENIHARDAYTCTGCRVDGTRKSLKSLHSQLQKWSQYAYSKNIIVNVKYNIKSVTPCVPSEFKCQNIRRGKITRNLKSS